MHPDQQLFDWINAHIADDPAKLRLKYAKKIADAIDYTMAIIQVECRRKYAKKLAQTLSECPQFIFPSTLSGEQCTSDSIATWHATLIVPDTTVLDMTAGLGIDAMHIAKKAKNTTAVERQPNYAKILEHNTKACGIDNIEVVCDDSRHYICNANHSYDTVFIDPARRAADGSRVFDIAQCQPDVTKLITPLKAIASTLIVKLSPMLDIARTSSQLPGITDIYAVGTPTECKEIVLKVNLCDNDFNPNPLIHAVTISENATQGINTPQASSINADALTFTRQEEAQAIITFANPAPGQTLFEPLPALMKAAPFALLCQRFNLAAIGPNSHLYLGATPADPTLNSFFKTHVISKVLPYSSSIIKRLHRTYPSLSITTRNFPISAQTLRAKLKVADTASPRLFATTDNQSQPIMIICE